VPLVLRRYRDSLSEPIWITEALPLAIRVECPSVGPISRKLQDLSSMKAALFPVLVGQADPANEENPLASPTQPRAATFIS
jgi:hypothetical protein